MPSFDIVCEANLVEVKNAVEQANKEIANRFDFKGVDARFELKEKEHEITAYADDEFKLGQVLDVLRARLAKRNVDVRALETGAVSLDERFRVPAAMEVGPFTIHDSHVHPVESMTIEPADFSA